MLSIGDLRERLSEIRLLGTKQNIVEAGFVQRIDWDGSRVEVDVVLPPVSAQARQVLEQDIRRALGAFAEVRDVQVRIGGGDRVKGQGSEFILSGVRHVIAVASAKGGVGKSTVAANLALALSSEGLRVGLLDADVYGPSLPLLFGTRGPVTVTSTQHLAPVEKFGLQLMSVGFFVEEEAPVIWRGPVVMSLVRQFLRDVEWHDLDFLVVDLPPGTGDAPLSLLQLIPIAGALMVTTPQSVAVSDVERGIAMFQRVQAPVLGIVENMALYECPHCHTTEELFGSEGGQRLERQFGIPVIARIPLDPQLRAASDSGQPLPVQAPGHPLVTAFRTLAQRFLERLAASDVTGVPIPTIIN